MNKLNIIYEDNDLIATNKPAGIIVHADDHHDSGFLDIVREKFVTADYLHRLDKDTSGVLLFSKNEDGHEHYKDLFRDRSIQKTYKALVVGNIKHEEGSVELPIGRSSSDPRKRVVNGKKGLLREACTDYKVLERFGDKYSLVDLYPKTGRTHQIRVHMTSIGHPVACDGLYGGKRFACPIEGGRQLLHASAIEFTDRNGERRKIEAEEPEDFQSALKSLREGAGHGTTG